MIMMMIIIETYITDDKIELWPIDLCCCCSLIMFDYRYLIIIFFVVCFTPLYHYQDIWAFTFFFFLSSFTLHVCLVKMGLMFKYTVKMYSCLYSMCRFRFQFDLWSPLSSSSFTFGFFFIYLFTNFLNIMTIMIMIIKLKMLENFVDIFFNTHRKKHENIKSNKFLSCSKSRHVPSFAHTHMLIWNFTFEKKFQLFHGQVFLLPIRLIVCVCLWISKYNGKE